MAVQADTKLMLTFIGAEDRGGPVEAHYDAENKVVVLSQANDTVWVPYADFDAFLERLRRWSDDMSND